LRYRRVRDFRQASGRQPVGERPLKIELAAVKWQTGLAAVAGGTASALGLLMLGG